MCTVISILHVACMRSISLPKLVLVAALGCMLLSGCGTQNSATDQTAAGNAGSAATPLDAPSSVSDPEMRFLALLTRITQSCTPDAPSGKGTGGVPEPEDLPGWEGTASPRYGPGETPSGFPNAAGDIPVPVDGAAPTKPAPDPTEAKPVEEVSLTGIEKCTGDKHAKRISEAFKDTKTTSYQTMRKRLTDLDYPVSRIHQMPNQAGAPRARLDLRVIGSHLALEVTGASSRVTIDAFGVPETEDVNVTDVKRKPKLDAPTS
ncbi:hypothetical protein [Streptomyces sp. NPDC056660]|uniref:hypothetical protein n=1 Tax=Streptomyces sp. NPDC056660 TaxID=3345897 RepID=UPI003683D146